MDDEVLVRWRAIEVDRRVAGEDRPLRIPLGDHTLLDIAFTPESPAPLRLELTSSKTGHEQFRDARLFMVE